MRRQSDEQIHLDDRLFMQSKVSQMMLLDSHESLFEPKGAIIAAPTPVATAQATLTGVGATVNTDNAETTQVTPQSLDVDMPSAEEQQVYVKEEHLLEWIIAKIENARLL